MKRCVEVVLSPSLADCYNFEGKTVVVIDIFRATTTIAAALSAGVPVIYSTLEASKALELKSDICLTAGERNGEKLDGFDLGNSPTEMLELNPLPKEIAITSTNGTKCIEMALSLGASEVICGSISNAKSVVNYLENQDNDVILFCAGWKNRVNLEDSFCAGLIVNKSPFLSIDCDSASFCSKLHFSNKTTIEAFLSDAVHYARLKKFGCEADLEVACKESIFNVVPEIKSFKNSVALISNFE